MSNNNQTLTEGNYLRIEIGLNKPFDETHLLTIAFPDGVKPEEKAKKVYVVYLLCKSEKDALNLKSAIDSNSIVEEKVKGETYCIEIGKKWGVVKLIDPDTRLNLGNSVIFTTSASSEYKFQIAASFIRPPEWIPIENGKSLRIDAKKCPLEVLVVDRKIGEIVYRTDSVEIMGTDLRVYGDQIRYEKGNTVVIKNWADGGVAEVSPLYQLEVQGTGLEIKGIRTSDVERIRIRRDEKIKVKVGGEVNKAIAFLINWWRKVNLRAGLKSVLYSFNFFALLVALVAMTWLPFGQANYAFDKYNEMRRSMANTYFESVPPPVEVSNKLSLQMVGSGGETNNVATTSTSTSAARERGVGNDNRKSQGCGGGVVTFYFVMACLLYVVLYAIVVLVAIASFKAMRRHNKMTRNMSSVIEALRNERDKEKRREMQKKILDDMINTYLERPSSED